MPTYEYRCKACRAELDIEPLRSFSGLVTYRSNDEAKKKARDFIYRVGL